MRIQSIVLLSVPMPKRDARRLLQRVGKSKNTVAEIGLRARTQPDHGTACLSNGRAISAADAWVAWIRHQRASTGA